MDMRVCLVLLCLGAGVLPGVPARSQEKIRDEEQARAWLEELNDRMEQAFSRKIGASWNYYTNITDHNQDVMVGPERPPLTISNSITPTFQTITKTKQFMLQTLIWIY